MSLELPKGPGSWPKMTDQKRQEVYSKLLDLKGETYKAGREKIARDILTKITATDNKYELSKSVKDLGKHPVSQAVLDAFTQAGAENPNGLMFYSLDYLVSGDENKALNGGQIPNIDFLAPEDHVSIQKDNHGRWRITVAGATSTRFTGFLFPPLTATTEPPKEEGKEEAPKASKPETSTAPEEDTDVDTDTPTDGEPAPEEDTDVDTDTPTDGGTDLEEDTDVDTDTATDGGTDLEEDTDVDTDTATDGEPAPEEDTDVDTDTATDGGTDLEEDTDVDTDTATDGEPAPEEDTGASPTEAPKPNPQSKLADFLNNKSDIFRGATFEGTFENGKITFPDGGTLKGAFDEVTGGLVKGLQTLPDGGTNKGTFDRDTKRLVEGVATFPNGATLEGAFDKETGRLVEGVITFPNGETLEGAFDKETGRLVEGVATFPDGRTREGAFDKETGRLVEGVATFPDGRTLEGAFDKETGRLVEGTVKVNGMEWNVKNGETMLSKGDGELISIASLKTKLEEAIVFSREQNDPNFNLTTFIQNRRKLVTDGSFTDSGAKVAITGSGTVYLEKWLSSPKIGIIKGNHGENLAQKIAEVQPLITALNQLIKIPPGSLNEDNE